MGVRTPPPLLGHDVGFLTLGPKLDPPPFSLVDLRCSGGSRVCVCDRGDHPPLNLNKVIPLEPDTENLCKVCVTETDHPPPLGMWMTSHGQCPRGGACECLHPPLQEILYPRLRWTPPPFKKSWIRPCIELYVIGVDTRGPIIFYRALCGIRFFAPPGVMH